MSITTYEGRVERGQVRLREGTVLPESAKVYVVIPEAELTGSSWTRELYDLFATVREEAAQYRAEEVDADIDAAITAVRGKHA